MKALLDRYYLMGWKLIPIYGAPDADGKWNPKRPGYVGWQERSMERSVVEEALRRGFNMGVQCGSVSGNLWVVDYDLHGSDWRRQNIPVLQALKTLVCLTPSGGFHVYLKTHGKSYGIGDLAEALTPIPFHIKPDLIRGENQQCLVPPSKVSGHSYFWLDNGKTKVRCLD